MKYEFHTGLDLQACMDRLQKALDSQANTSTFSYKTLTGSIEEKGVFLRLKRGWKDFYSPQFQGVFIEHEQNVTLRGEFKTAPGTKVILIVWFSFWFLNMCVLPLLLAVFSTISIIFAGDSLQVPPQEIFAALTTFGFYACLAFAVSSFISLALVLYLRHNQKNHQKHILSLLGEILDVQAQQVT